MEETGNGSKSEITEDENKEQLGKNEEAEDSSAKEGEEETSPTVVMEEEGKHAPTEEGTVVAATSEVTEEGAEGALASAMEEGTSGLPEIATEEEKGGLPEIATEEETGGLPEIATEEEKGGLPEIATEEEIGGLPEIATEEEIGGLPEIATEDKTQSIPVDTMEEGAGGPPVMTTEEGAEDAGGGAPEALEEEAGRIPSEIVEETAPSMTTSQDIPEDGRPIIVKEQVPGVFSHETQMGTVPSRVIIDASLSSSETSSLSSELPEQAEDHVIQGTTRPVVYPPYTDSALQMLSLQLGAMDGPEDESMLHFAERDVGGGDAEEETQLVVLDPEHPLMKRFQSALKDYLNKQIGKMSEELRELMVATKNGKVQREELGVILYGVQQQLAQLQMELEKNHNCHSQIAMARRQLEEELHDLRGTYKKTCHSAEDERKRVSAMQTEMESLSLRLFYMKNMDQDVRDDIAVMKRTVKKAEIERIRAEVEKQKQDLHVDRLTRRANELQEQIALYEAQQMAQGEDTRITRQEVAEASIEIQAIHLEKKQLLHQWTVSLNGMKRRDEAYAAMQEALRESRHRLKSLEIEIEVYKKSIIKEEERNELLASILNRSENDANTSRKLIAQSLAKQEAMKVEFSTYTRTLHETEQALSRATMDQASRMNELVILRREIEKGSLNKQQLENEIIGKLQDQLMSSKAAKYYSQLAAKLQDQLMTLEIQLTKVENDTAQTLLDITNTNCKLNTLQKTLSDLDKEMDNLNKEISHSENEIAKRNLLIGHKQGLINLYNKKLEMFISQLGGQELGPLEIEIKKLAKQIDDTEVEVMKLQRQWMKLQRELVRLTEEREEQLASLDMLKKEITIKEQKKIRVENEIQQEKNELKDIERHMKNMANDLVKLHLLINKNRENSEELQQGNTIMENEFVRTLKVSEREAIEMQEKLDSLQEEKERLLSSLVEAECHMMQWEKKIQLAKEMKAAVDSETGQGEIRAMKTEIHRMKVRHQQLMKQQEKLMRDMEAAVGRRETIVMRGEGQNKLNKKVLTKGDFHYKKLELKKKIKETQKNAEECNITIIHLENSQGNISNAFLEKQKEISLWSAEINELEALVEQLQATKRQNLSDIVAYQTCMKHLEAVKEGRYNLLCRSELMRRIEKKKLEDHLHAINAILHQIGQEYPHHQRALQRLSQILNNKLGTEATEQQS